VRSHRWLRGLEHILHQPSLWHLNRHSAARGVAVGTFWGFIPVPGQTILSVLSAVKLRGNVGLAFFLPWLATPILLPAWYLCYRLGLLILRQRPIDHFFDDIRALKGFAQSARWFWTHRAAVLPLVVGSVPVALLLAVIGYFGTQWLWRWVLVRRLRRRQQRLTRQATPADPVAV
jgi:uncharacterized protein (DUF2062 family)